MKSQSDLSGLRFGRLHVVAIAAKHTWKSKTSEWVCSCDCGSTTQVQRGRLVRGETVSCGCYGKSKATKHGLHRSPEYCAWEHMKQRCYNPNSKNYHLYGGRGIRVCAEWFRDFSIFYADMGPRPSPGYSIDRIDVNEHYKPENCRWATHEQQARNRRSSTLVEVEGKMVSLAEAAEITGISRKTLSTRICRGWTGEKLLSPVAQILSFSHAERGDG